MCCALLPNSWNGLLHYLKTINWGTKMTKIALGLYIVWIILLILKYLAVEKDTTFSYFRVFFGRITWYRNTRVLILLVSLLLIEIFLPLKQIYLLFFITGIITVLMSLANFKFKAGKTWISSLVLIIGIGIISIASFFIF